MHEDPTRSTVILSGAAGGIVRASMRKRIAMDLADGGELVKLAATERPASRYPAQGRGPGDFVRDFARMDPGSF